MHFIQPSISKIFSFQHFTISCHCCLVTQSCLTLVTPWTVACQAPLSMEFSRKEYWSRLPFPSLGDCPNQGTGTVSPALAGRFFINELPGKPLLIQFTFCPCTSFSDSRMYFLHLVSDQPHCKCSMITPGQGLPCWTSYLQQQMMEGLVHSAGT